MRPLVNSQVKRNVLLNPGPATTTDTVKYAQVIPDICPREDEFADLMKNLGDNLLQVVHADPAEYSAVLFCGSGTVNIDACISSLLPSGKKILIVNNGVYSDRGAEVCKAYHIDYVNLELSYTMPVSPPDVEAVLKGDPDIAVVYMCHHETGTGVLNPIRDVGEIVHRYGAVFVVDTTSTYAMIPMDMAKDNVDFLMASAQKGLMAMTGLSFVIGKTSLIEASKDYPTRSYYTNVYMQYKFIKQKGEMRFTPPVQTIYALKQALVEYFQEGETAKWNRHRKVWEAIYHGLDALGFRMTIQREHQSQLVVSAAYPQDPRWSFDKVHDYCYEKGFTIYPGKISGLPTFRLCAYGAIEESDIEDFFIVFKEAVQSCGIPLPLQG